MKKKKKKKKKTSEIKVVTDTPQTSKMVAINI